MPRRTKVVVIRRQEGQLMEVTELEALGDPIAWPRWRYRGNTFFQTRDQCVMSSLQQVR